MTSTPSAAPSRAAVDIDGRSPGPGVGPVMDKAAAENFTVASRLLPASVRAHLLSIYGYARFVDDTGDLAEGDRCAQLDWIEAELDRCFAGAATHPVFVRLGASVAALRLERRPFDDLLAANRQDQVVHRYATYDELAAYCALSANPVGRLVLAVFGQSSAEAVRLSDAICTGLQLVEHWQDVAEDYRSGRVYLPGCDLDAFAVAEAELASPRATPALRRLLAFEVARARRLLDDGAPLVGLLRGPARIAVAGFLGGGRAQLDAIERASYDVLATQVKASRAAVALESARSLRAARPRRRRGLR